MLQPEEQLAPEQKTFSMEMEVNKGAVEDIAIYRSDSASFATWTRVEAEIEDGKATFQAQHGGVYVAVKHSNAGLIAGAVIGTLILVAVIAGGTFFYLRKNPAALSNMKRSFQSKV